MPRNVPKSVQNLCTNNKHKSTKILVKSSCKTSKSRLQSRGVMINVVDPVESDRAGLRYKWSRGTSSQSTPGSPVHNRCGINPPLMKPKCLSVHLYIDLNYIMVKDFRKLN